MKAGDDREQQLLMSTEVSLIVIVATITVLYGECAMCH